MKTEQLNFTQEHAMQIFKELFVVVTLVFVSMIVVLPVQQVHALNRQTERLNQEIKINRGSVTIRDVDKQDW